MVVSWEVYRGERNITEETGGGALVEADETKILYDPEGRAAGDSFDVFRDFSLYLEPNLHDFKGAWMWELALGHPNGREIVGHRYDANGGPENQSAVVTSEDLNLLCEKDLTSTCTSTRN